MLPVSVPISHVSFLALPKDKKYKLLWGKITMVWWCFSLFERIHMEYIYENFLFVMSLGKLKFLIWGEKHFSKHILIGNIWIVWCLWLQPLLFCEPSSPFIFLLPLLGVPEDSVKSTSWTDPLGSYLFYSAPGSSCYCWVLRQRQYLQRHTLYQSPYASNHHMHPFLSVGRLTSATKA